MFGRFFRQEPEAETARTLYDAIVARARDERFYRALGVPDSIDGRFELVALHMFLVLHRLKGERPAATELGQRLVDTFFADMDQSLRELGAGDLGVAPRIRRMAEGFYGRVAAYEAGLAAAGDVLESALARNLYGTVEPAEASLAALAAYVRDQAARLAAQDGDALAEGRVDFAPVAEGERR
jgi:cytochrome b pre-mRNA-processing protein 3